MKETGTDRQHDVDARPQIVADLHGLRERVANVERAEPMLAHDHRCLQHFGQRAQFALGTEHAAADENRGIAGLPEQDRCTGDAIGIRLRRRRRGQMPADRRRGAARGRHIGRNFHDHRAAAATVQLAKGFLDHCRSIFGRCDASLPFGH
jgi:hypothetical protein